MDSTANAPMSTLPIDALEILSSCRVCGGDKRQIVYEGLHDSTFFAIDGKWTLFRCLDCRCAFLSPRLSPEWIGLAYTNYYTHVPSDLLNTERLTKLGRVRRSIVNGYRNRRFGSQLSPASRAGALLLGIFPSQRRIRKHEFRNLPRSAGAVLDVGFGSGQFLELATSAGWEAYGADPDRLTVSSALQRGLRVRLGGIEAFSDCVGFFDYITMRHVLEHVHEPKAALEMARRLLRPGGQIWIETPNLDSWTHKRFEMHWRGLEVPRHLTLFTWDALENLLLELGFGAIRRVAPAGGYARMAAECRLVRDGSGAGYAAPGIADRLRGAFFYFAGKVDYRHKEMIVLVTSKT
jgi:2-polyprenyl-3-methyl-5-hydroxy-6-metoxy-1,4-benzoquinol methylase